VEVKRVSEQEGGPDLVTFREAARRAVAEKITPTMSHQRLSQLARDDPRFPPTEKIGPARVVDWLLLRPFLIEHQEKAASRDRRRRFDDGSG
jgi:hypothetical protein